MADDLDQVATAVLPTARKARPQVAQLQTPQSASYPSEIRSPFPGTPAFVKQEEVMRTPVTPPSAYLDFLKSISPALMSPAPTGTTSVFDFKESFPDRPPPAARSIPNVASPPCTSIASKRPQPAPVSRTTSTDSVATVSTTTTSMSSEGSSESDSTGSSSTKTTKRRADSPGPSAVLPQFRRPSSAKLPKRLQIPNSALSPALTRSPMSARSLHGPRSASSLCATPWSATFKPVETEARDKTGRVNVRQVVTQTVTYTGTTLKPAPKGKRRKLEDEEAGSSTRD